MKTLLTISTLVFTVMFSSTSFARVQFVILETIFSSTLGKMRVEQRGNNSFRSKKECEGVMKQKYLFDGYTIEKREHTYGTPNLVFKNYFIRDNHFSGKEISCHPIFGDWNIKSND